MPEKALVNFYSIQRGLKKPNASKSYLTFNPLGVVLSIMPWNSHFGKII